MQISLARIVLKVVGLAHATPHFSTAVSTLAACRSADNFQNECHHVQYKENISASVSQQPAERLVHVIIDVATFITRSK